MLFSVDRSHIVKYVNVAWKTNEAQQMEVFCLIHPPLHNCSWTFLLNCYVAMGPICLSKMRWTSNDIMKISFPGKEYLKEHWCVLLILSLLQHQTQIHKPINYYKSKLWQVWTMAKSYREGCYSPSLRYLNSSYVQVAKATIQVLN